MFLTYLILALKIPKYRPQKSWILYSLLIFTGIAIITSIFGINPRLSFIGDLERMWSINMWLHLVLFFVVITSVLKSKKEWFVFLNVALITASYIAIYGYLQRWGVEGIFQTGIKRIQSVLGNSAYVAGILLLSSILSVYLLIKTKGFWWKSLFGFHLLIQLPAMFMAEIRGAQVAFLFVLLIISIAFLFKMKDKKIKYGIVGFLLLLVIVFGLAFKNKEASWVKDNSILHRLTSISLTKGTTRTRLISWSAGLNAIQERPIMGFGMENYYYAFDKYLQADYYNIAASETWFDRAHNMVVENLVAHGVFGLLAYLSIFLITLFYLFKIYKKDPEENWLFSLFFGSLVIAYFIQNFFVFDSLAVTMFFFFILAYINHKINSKLEKKVVCKREFPVFVNGVVISLGIILSFYFLFGMNSSHAQIAKQNYEVQRSFYQDQDLGKTYNEMEKLFEIDSYVNRDSVTMITDTLIQMGSQIKTQRQAQDFFKMIDFLLKEYQVHEKISDQDAYFKLNLARLNLLKASFLPEGSLENIAILNNTNQVLEKAIELSPERLHNYYFVYQVYAHLGNQEKAIESLETALKYNPEYGETYLYLSNAYLLADYDKSLVLEMMDGALNYNVKFNSSEQILKAISLYKDVDGHLDQKIKLLKLLLQKKESPDVYRGLYELYKEKGDLEIAEEYLNKASKLYNKN